MKIRETLVESIIIFRGCTELGLCSPPFSRQGGGRVSSRPRRTSFLDSYRIISQNSRNRRTSDTPQTSRHRQQAQHISRLHRIRAVFSSFLPPGKREGIIAAQAYTVTCIISYTAQGFRQQPFPNEIKGLHHIGVLSLLSYVDVRINVHNETRLERIFVAERPQLT